MWHIMLSDIPQFEQTNNKHFLYNNLTIHPIWVCCIDSMSLSHPFKPWLALVLSLKYCNTDNVMTVKIGQTHCRMLFLPLFTSITQKLLLVFFFIYIVQYVTYVLVAEYLLFNDC